MSNQFELSTALAQFQECDARIRQAREEQASIRDAIRSTCGFNLEAELTFWYSADAQNDACKVLEPELRKHIFNHEFPDPVKGTNKKKIEHGMALIAKHKINYKVDRPLLDAMIKEPQLAELVHQVIRFDPKVKEGEWEKMSDKEKGKIAVMITETPGTPELEIKSQGKVRW